MTTKLIPFVPATNRMKVRDRRQLRIKWIFKNDDWFVIRWHVYDTQYKWQLTDPGPSLISRPIPTAFLLLPSFILQPMKLSIFSQKLPLRGWLVLNRISCEIREFPCSCPVGNCFISSVDCWHINLPLLKHNDYPITQLLLSLERSSCYWEW